MKYNHHFFIIIWVLVYTVPVATMERNNQMQRYNHDHWLNSVQEITTVKNPRHVKYFIENQLIVAENDAVYSINLKTKERQTIQKPNFLGRNIIGLQGNSNRIIFCNFSRLNVFEFKKEIGKPDYRLDWIEELDWRNNIRSFTWNPLKDTFFVCYGEKKEIIRQRNYTTGKYKDIVMDDQICQIMTMHPTQEVMCIADYSGNISLRNVDDTLSKIKTIFLGSKLKSSLFCQYSLDGSCIVVGGQKEIMIVYLNKNINKFPCIQAQRGENFDKIAFHPNGSILAILCSRTTATLSRLSACTKRLVQYWNIKTQQFIGETPELDCRKSYDLCFSDDGLEIVVALADKCVRMHVPFAIKDKCIYSLWVLNQFKEPSLPKDVVSYNVNILLELFKF